VKKSFLFGSNAEMVVGWRCGGQAQVGAEAQVGSMVCEKQLQSNVWHSGPG
jgi:hypothetical protein